MRAGQGGDRGLLDESDWAGRGDKLNAHHLIDDRRVDRGVAEAPSGHGVGFTEPVYDDRTILHREASTSMLRGVKPSYGVRS